MSYVFRRVSSLRPEKKSSSHLSGKKKKIQLSVCWVRGSGDYYRKKKVPVVCLAGYAVVVLVITTGKKKSSSHLSGEKKKIQSSVCWVRGSGDYDRKNKKFQSSVWRVVD